MNISGMANINKNLRNESRARAALNRKDSSEVSSLKSRGSNTYVNKKKLILSILFLLLSVTITLTILNWRSVNRLIDALDIGNPVNNKVINQEMNKDGADRTILIITSGETDTDISIEKVYLLSYNEQKGERVVIHIPGEVYIPLANKEIAPYSSVSNLYYAGETIKPGLGFTYAIWELEEYIGYEFDSYLWLGDEARLNFEENMGVTEDDDPEKYFSKIVAISNPVYLLLRGEKLLDVSDSIYSNLDSQEVFNKLSKYMMNTFAEVNFIDFSEGDYIVQEALSTGDEVPFLDQGEVDDTVNQIGIEMLDKSIEKEQTKIEVYNGSEISGLAGRFSRALKNNGLNVIRVDNSDQKIEVTRIYSPNLDDYANSLNIIQSLMPTEVEIVEGRPTFLTTADIIVILGEDNGNEIDWLFD